MGVANDKEMLDVVPTILIANVTKTLMDPISEVFDIICDCPEGIGRRNYVSCFGAIGLPYFKLQSVKPQSIAASTGILRGHRCVSLSFLGFRSSEYVTIYLYNAVVLQLSDYFVFCRFAG